jgi:crotonobetainyl-CoA:carnitine CoA-transferase CaiB-like acyl-CoA transferase
MTDCITGLYAAFGATLALLARGKTGRGQCIDAALYECAFSFMEPWIPAFDKLGHIANRCGSRLPESTPNNLYATGDGNFIHVTAMGEAVFQRLAAAMGQPGLAEDERFRVATARSAHHEELDDIIGRWTASLPLATLEKVLEEAGVPATRIFTIADIFGDPHYRARGSIVHAPDPDFDTVAMAAVVPRLSRTPGEVRHAGRRIGEDTREVLRTLLGLDDARLDDLQAKGVIASETKAPEEQS